MIRVFINPPSNPNINSIGGIDRVVDAQHAYLNEFGIDIASNADSADVIANHATLLEERPGVPMISHCHGLYWSDYKWPTWTELANKEVIESMRRASAVTAPSQWVAAAISRGMLIAPEVIYHGVDIDEWVPGESMGFVIWNKARDDSISTPKYMQDLAQIMPDIQFVSTFGIPTSNVKVVGPLGQSHMKFLLQKSGVYLSTTRETFGIGTIEALSCGVPVVGWDYGGQSEIIVNDQNGYLVPYGDYNTLKYAVIEALSNRDRLSENARQDAIDRWQWRDKVGQYANLYKSVYNESKIERPRVSIVVTTYNLSQYLGDCIQSVIDQSISDWEIVVVDDCSQDNPKKIIDEINDSRIHYLRTRENVGLSTARNIGCSKSKGKYIIFLDADDMFDPATLEILSDALDRDSGIHIAYGALDTVSDDGSGRRRNEWPRDGFDWRAQISHLNQMPYASMMRREVMERSGGYRDRDWRAEDASLWIRLTSFGFRSKMVTDRPTLIYRFRADSKSAQERREHQDRDGDWTRWFPWRTGASSGVEGEDIYYKNTKPNANLVPFGAQGSPPNKKSSWPVHHHSHPVVSVIIPVASSHRRYLVDALDSCIAQTIIDWEAIVIDDSRDASMPDVIQSHPFARVFYSMGNGASRARNIGIMHAHGQFVLFLDADDVLEPNALESMLRAYVRENGGYVYCDCKLIVDSEHLDGPGEVIESVNYDQETFIRCGYTDNMPGCHSVTMLVAKADIDQTNGFDETLAYWEDWKLPLEFATLGIRGIRVPSPLLIYRLDTGVRRRASRVHEGTIKEILREQFEPYTTGEKQMCACTGGNGGSVAKNAALKALGVLEQPTAYITQIGETEDINNFVANNGTVRLRYVGDKQAGVPYRGRVSRIRYVFGRDPSVEFVDVDVRDAPDLMRTGEFQIIDTSVIIERSAVWR